MDWRNIKLRAMEKLNRALELEEVDKPIIPILNVINNWDFAFSTSSCSGRILFLLQASKKGLSEKYLSWHSIPEKREFIKAFNEFVALEDERVKWVKVEPFILHIAFCDADYAFSFFSEMVKLGVKRGGVRKVNYGYHVEARGNDFMAIPLDTCSINTESFYEAAKRLMEHNNMILEKIYNTFKNWEVARRIKKKR